MMNNNVELAYLAGLVDGEGCIHINKWRNLLKNGHQYALLVQIKMCDGRLLKELHRKYGGNLRLLKRSLENPNHSDILVWRLGNRNAQAFLERLLPYLRLKRRQAEIGINFSKSIPGHRGSRALTEGEIAGREQSYNLLRELKQSERTYRLI